MGKRENKNYDLIYIIFHRVPCSSFGLGGLTFCMPVHFMIGGWSVYLSLRKKAL